MHSNLVSALQALGLKTMFNESTADFSGITTDEQVYVDQAIQKAFIKVCVTRKINLEKK